MKFINSSIKNKKILLRVDFNVSLNPNHTIANDERIKQSLPTIKLLLKNDNRLIIVSHLGEPKGRDFKFSLQPVVTDLQNYLPDYTVKLIPDFLAKSPVILSDRRESKDLDNNNEILVLENIRFYPEELDNDLSFAKQLASLAEVYVNDAFAVCHRQNASVVSVPKYLPSYGGLLLKKEIRALTQITVHPTKPFVAIIGGAKISTKLPLLYKLTNIADYLILGGGIANTFLKAQGYEIGNSLHDDGQAKEVLNIIEHAKKQGAKILLPNDFVTQDKHRNTITKQLGNLKTDDLIFDIGPETEAIFGSVIDKAKTIVWNGPLGYFENPAFAAGTEFIYYAITQNQDCFSLVGGGDTLNAISKREYLEKISFISTAGGAMLEYLTKGTLPGIQALG